MQIQLDLMKCNRCNESLPEEFLIENDNCLGVELVCNSCFILINEQTFTLEGEN